MIRITKTIRFKPSATILSRDYSPYTFEELYEKSKQERKRADEKFEKHLELLDKTKQEISKTKDEISNLNIVMTERTQKLQTIPDNDSEYQQLNRIDGNYLQWKKESLNRLVGELNDLQSKIGEDVRSLFADYNYIIPEPTLKNDKLTLQVNEELINLSFVNRKQELLKAWDACATNTMQPNKHNLLVCGQTFGTGKTTFGRQLFNFNNPDIERIFEETSYPSSILFQTLPVFINIPDFDYQFEDTGDLVSCSMFAATLNQYFNIDKAKAIEFWRKKKKDLFPSHCASLLLSMVHRPLFFHFDEVNVLVEWFPPKPNKDPEAVFGTLWRSLVEVQTSGCFAYVSGKAPVINFIGSVYDYYGSVGQSTCIFLSLLKTNDIKDILWSSSLSSGATSIGARLKITTEEEAEHIAKWLYHITTGVPRYVEQALIEMVNRTDSAKCLMNWGIFHEDSMMEKLMNVQDLLPSFNFSDATQKKEIESLVRFAIDREIITTFSRSDDNHFVTDLAPYHGFHLEVVHKEREEYRIEIPRLWVHADIFKELSINTLLKKSFGFPRTLENHVERVLLERSAYPTRGKPIRQVKDRIPFLSETLVANEIYPTLISVPMENKEFEKREEIFHGDVHIATSAGCLLVRPVDKSSLPAVMTLLPITSNTGRYFIGWQVKNYPTAKLGQAAIKKEIAKFADNLLTRGCKGGVFVILLNGSGSRVVEENRGKVIRAADSNQDTWSKEATLELNLPRNVEVFIPTRDQLNEYFGEKPWKELSQHE